MYFINFTLNDIKQVYNVRFILPVFLRFLWDSIVGMVTGYVLDDQGVGVQGQEFSLLDVFQTSSGVYPTSYPMGIVGSFPRGKAAGA
jgi:hypothetical protein